MKIAQNKDRKQEVSKKVEELNALLQKIQEEGITVDVSRGRKLWNAFQDNEKVFVQVKVSLSIEL